jgi:hypothetical protein
MKLKKKKKEADLTTVIAWCGGLRCHMVVAVSLALLLGHHFASCIWMNGTRYYYY